jgi:hypothetical protein
MQCGLVRPKAVPVLSKPRRNPPCTAKPFHPAEVRRTLSIAALHWQWNQGLTAQEASRELDSRLKTLAVSKGNKAQSCSPDL